MLHDPLRVISDWLQVHPVVLLIVGFVLGVLVGWGIAVDSRLLKR